MPRSIRAGFAVLLAVAAPAAAEPQAAAATAEARAFDAFLGRAAPLCRREAARRCIDAGWRFADRDRNGGLTVAELDRVRRELRAWLRWKRDRIPAAERRGVQIGLAIVEAIGLPALVEGFDRDRNGRVERAELLRDVRLDNRPLGKVLRDPDAVDWKGIQRHLGALAPALGRIAPGLGRPKAPAR